MERGMTGVRLAPWAMERAMGRRGVAHPFADLHGPRTALVVIDLQWGYMHPDGGYLECPAARNVVPAVNAMAATLRNAGGLVAWVQNTHDESCLRTWTVQQAMNSDASNARRNAAMTPGAKGHALWPALEVRDGDEVAAKTRYSAFMPGTCGLEGTLRARGIDTVLVAGTLTNVCCDSSARDAMMLDFRTVMLSDGCAATSAEEHDAALSAFYATFGDVMDVAFATERLRAGMERAAA